LIYLDASVVLAQLLAEDAAPPAKLWDELLVSSRLLEYEVWVRLNARKLGKSHGSLAREVMQRIAFVEMAPQVLARALEPFPGEIRTLDALHLASIIFLREQRQEVELATYDSRIRHAASLLGIPAFGL
jgi:predicted nucleic acid-binding protein